MNHLDIIKDMEDIPLYPALSLIIKGHNTFFDEKLKGTEVSAAELPYLVRIYGQDHHFSKNTFNFKKLPEKYLLKKIK